MARRGLHSAVGTLASLALASATLGADVAGFAALGFSADGRHFAYEQYGIHDGGPAAYAEIHVIDVVANQHVGAPLKRVLEPPADVATETALAALRRDLREAARPLMKRVAIVEGEAGRLLIHRPETDLGADPHDVRFAVAAPVYGRPAPDEYRLLLVEEKVDSPPHCADWGPVATFRLSLRREGQDDEHLMQRDQHLPRSRGCASRYRIRDVRLHGSEALVVVVSYAVPGFEGRSIRHLAVTGMLSHQR